MKLNQLVVCPAAVFFFLFFFLVMRVLSPFFVFVFHPCRGFLNSRARPAALFFCDCPIVNTTKSVFLSPLGVISSFSRYLLDYHTENKFFSPNANDVGNE